MNGPGTVTDAIMLGHKAAHSMAHFLSGEILKIDKVGDHPTSYQIEREAIPSFLVRKDRWDMPSLSTKDSIRSFDEVKLGFTMTQMREEAKRCLNCRMCGNCIFERGQLCFEVSTRLL